MTPLTRAYRYYWDKGIPLPIDIASRLLAKGYDVEALEQKQLNKSKHRNKK